MAERPSNLTAYHHQIMLHEALLSIQVEVGK